MLSFDIGSLAAKAAVVDGRLASDDPVWEEGDPRPMEGVRVTGRLSSAGGGRFYFRGRIDGRIADACRRCLTDVVAPVHDEIDLLYVGADADEANEPDVYTVDPRARELDLRPAVREQWLLAVPRYVQCTADCKGLCPTCGTDLNAGPCDCRPAADSRWDTLRKLHTDPS